MAPCQDLMKRAKVVGLAACKVSDNLLILQKLAKKIGLEKALLPLTRTIATALCLENKGTLKQVKMQTRLL